MRWANSLPRRLATTAAGLLSVSLVAALVGAPPDKTQAEPRTPVAANAPAAVPLFATTQPAANKPELVLLPDEGGVRGWVAGATSYAGATATITVGNKDYQADIGADNTFTWKHTSAKPLKVAVRVPAAGGNKALAARATLPAKPEGNRRTAFVVTDRSAYRPGHTLKFVAYLHRTTDGIDFQPLANTDFTVDVVGETRQTRATRLKVRSDAHGRITGQYTFSDADSLDHYRLAVTETDSQLLLDGGARVLLGEYRKTKVGLKLKGEVTGGKLVVTFDARDYLAREVKGTSATWSAVVTKAADAEKLALDSAKFVANEGGPPSMDDFDALPDDERLLTLANGVSAMSFAGFGARTIATREGKAEFAGGKPATVDIDLWPEWTKGQHSVAVTATFLDETGRENRAVGTFSLSPAATKAVRIATPKELYATGEPVTATVTPTGLGAKDAPATTVIVVKLEASPSLPWITHQLSGDEGEPADTRIPAISAPKGVKKPVAEGWKAQPVFDPVKRTVLTAVPVNNGKAEVDLHQPGAYKLLAVTRLADGTVLQSETGVVVKAPAKLPGVVLQLDSHELNAGARLTGTVHTKFAGAKLLLTLRDASGVKLVKPLAAGANGVVRFDEALPPNLRYGCSVCVQYPESATNVHADQRDIFVLPTDRTLTITTTAPETVDAGAEVKLGLQVNRTEEVDLVVSVFDESLLGVSGDLSNSIRDFYLADARGHGRAARELAATRLGGVGIAELVAKGEKLLKNADALAKEPGLERRLTQLSEQWKTSKLTPNDVVTLVRLAGFEVYLSQPFYYHQSLEWRMPKAARLADLMRRDGIDDDNSKVYLSATVIDNVVLLGVANRNGVFDPWVGHCGNLYPNGFGSFCGGVSCNGFQQFSGQLGFSGLTGFNGQFGLAGISGFGGSLGSGIAGFDGPFNGRNFGIGGGIGGFGGGGFGGVPSGQAAFSQPFVRGQMGMSFGFNRDFGAPSGPASAPLPGLGLNNEVVRRDFADSAYWSATLRTDKAGKATASFKVPDSLTNWRVQVTAVSPKLHVGTATARFKTSRPVMIWPMLPRAFTEGDVVSVFGTVHNLSDKEQSVRVHLTAENGAVMSQGEQTVKVPANGNVAVYWTYKAGKPGMTDLLMSATCAAGSDASLKKLPVVAATVAERVTASGIVGKGELKLVMPDGFDPKTAQVTVTVAPTLAADLADTLPYLVEYPYGCVEQTMSRFLPALRVGLILKQSGISTIKPLEEKLPKVIEAGQKRLIALQQPDGGWAWNGDGQTHEMMTPYAMFGLLAAEEAGYPCPNPGTIDRGMARLRQYLDNSLLVWGLTPADYNPAKSVVRGQHNDSMFILWVYARKADAKELAPWWPRLERWAGSKHLSDSGHAFALELAVKHGKKELAEKLATELRKRAQKAGDRVFWTKAGFSHWGDNTTEVTATVMKALVAYDAKDPLIPGVLAYFHSTKRGDRWDSTKDTASVLYALCDYLAAVQAGPAASGAVTVALNGTEAGRVKLDSAASKTVKFAGKGLKAGANAFTIDGADTTGGALARVSVSFTRTGGKLTPARDHGVKVTRTISVRGANGEWTELKSGAKVPVGAYLKVQVMAILAAGDLRFFLIESPKPSGCETVAATDRRFPLSADGHVLREDREAMSCFHYETANVATAEFVVLAEFAGEFTLPPARGELMYEPTSGGHSDSFMLTVTPKK